MTNFFLPTSLNCPESEVWRWYLNIAMELRERFLTEGDKSLLREYYTEAGLLTQWRRPFFRRHYSRTFALAASFLLNPARRLTVLDLGCGAGTQSLYFALLGARVLAVDLDRKALQVLDRRRRHYEDLVGRPLEIVPLEANALTLDVRTIGPVDAIYSMFAFNVIQPSTALLDRLAVGLSADARLALLDGNNAAIMARVLPGRRRPSLTPAGLRNELELRGLRVISQIGGVSLPPIAWCTVPLSIVGPIDDMLNRTTWAPISCQTLASKGAAGSA